VDKVRLEKGMSLKTLSDKSGVSKSHIQKIEARETSPSLEVMCKLAKALGVPVRDLFSYE